MMHGPLSVKCAFMPAVCCMNTSV